MAKVLVTLDRPGQYPDTTWYQEILGTGVDLVRLNVARWQPQQVEQVTELIRRASPKARIMMDLGQKLRLMVPGGIMTVKVGQVWNVSTRPTLDEVSFNYDLSTQAIPSGTRVIMHDGRIVGQVTEQSGTHVQWKIVSLSEWDPAVDQLFGVRFEGWAPELSLFGQREAKFLTLAQKQGHEMVAFSFIESPEDVRRSFEALPGGYTPTIVVKIETQRGVNAIHEVAEVLPKGSLIMIARGDLYIGTPSTHLARLQRQAAQACKNAGVPFIIATGFLTSMCHQPGPSRAEVCDADAAARLGPEYLMLSEESCGVSRYPIEAIRTLQEICSLARL